MSHVWIKYIFDNSREICENCGIFRCELEDLECSSYKLKDHMKNPHKHKWIKSSDPLIRRPVCEICREIMTEESCLEPSNEDTMDDELISVSEVARLRYDNQYLRNYIAHSNLDCVYCKLPKNKMSECAMEGCARAEDINKPLIGRYEDI